MNVYRLLLVLLTLPITIYIAWVALRNKDTRFLLQRLGLSFSSLNKINRDAIWIHAASVGEVNAATPIIQQLAKNNNIILTTNTPSSAIRVANILSEQVTHFYCPIDWRWAMKKFIKKFQPQCLVIIETELWPNLFSTAKKLDLSITIINGRLSKRTLNAATWMRKRYRDCLATTSCILARSEEDKQRFIELGAKSSTVKTIGNIKFYQQENISEIKAFKTIRNYVLAASTRDKEEAMIISAWNKTEHNSSLLIIVPRHPKRITEIINDLKPYKLNIAIRSKGQGITIETDIYIADTFGELTSFIKGASFVIMGGSFVKKGGQNILEVAQVNKTVVFGPHMDNFKEEAQLFVEKQAGLQLKNIDSLTQTINQLLNKPEVNQQYQKNAKQLITQQQAILEIYLSELYNIYPTIKKA